MPRLSLRLFRQARKLSPEVATLLPVCRDLESASNEFRWIKDHVDKTLQVDKQLHLRKLCRQRGRGVPLQYVLGSQPFGKLDIKCKPGVLVPRSETEAYTCQLIDELKSGKLLGYKPHKLSVLDFCTGTGCIPLLAFSSLQQSVADLNVKGVDISPTALRLASKNISHNVEAEYIRAPDDQHILSFEHADVFSEVDLQRLASSSWDLMISNPPYISRDVWNHGRSQIDFSVRKYEPRLALVPGTHLPDPPEGLQPEDVFYSRLLEISEVLKPKVVLFEIGDEAQALRVLEYHSRHFIGKVELWRDWPGSSSTEFIDIGGSPVLVKGSGQARSIVIHRVHS